MLVVMSDTHFAESQSYQLGDRSYNNNLPALVYHNYFQELGIIVMQHKIKSVDLVLAGDIFELTRTGLWLEDELRPYIHINDVLPGSRIEERIQNILEAIQNDEHVGPTLELFRNIQQLIGVKVNLHYLPGNHDRLVNCTPAIRMKIRAMLGMGADQDPFPNIYIYAPGNKNLVLVRHGHEYDKVNFGMDIRKLSSVPILLDKNGYEGPVLGDLLTLEMATRLPLEFKRYYKPDVIQNDEKLLKLYDRLIDFDNVRPSSALLNFLLTTPGITNRNTWKLLEPIFLAMLESWTNENQFYPNSMFVNKSNTSTGFLLAFLITFRIKPRHIPYWIVKAIINLISKKMFLTNLAAEVGKEECIQDDLSGIKCVIMGHTHAPEVELIGVANGIEKYYINTGTWRKKMPASHDNLNFGHLRMLSKIIVLGPDERNLEYDETSGWSFDINSELGYGYELRQ
jgi:UDP-2,3-diacylglucosamine pyrophosphatase LpxH